MLKQLKSKRFANGVVYLLETEDGFKIETTDTFLPYYTKNCINSTNKLDNKDLGSRAERWMVGVSVMSGCPVKCGFCATAKLKNIKLLSTDEIVEQVMFIVEKNKKYLPNDSQEFKINYTRMGEPFLNIDNIKKAIEKISSIYPNTHHYVSTIGIKGSDFSWIKGNITLQLSLHSLDENRRNELIPYKNKLTIKELGEIRTESKLKTTINLTLVDEKDFDIKELSKYFDKEKFFIKLSPINKNEVSEKNQMGEGIIQSINVL